MSCMFYKLSLAGTKCEISVMSCIFEEAVQAPETLLLLLLNLFKQLVCGKSSRGVSLPGLGFRDYGSCFNAQGFSTYQFQAEPHRHCSYKLMIRTGIPLAEHESFGESPVSPLRPS